MAKRRVLTGLRVDEVSVVDKGAGEDCKIVFWKRDAIERERHRVQDEADLSLRHLKPSRAMLFNEVMKAKSDIPPRDEEPRARGPNLANYFNDLMKGHASMNRTEELRDIAKAAGGMAAIAKSIIAKGATNFTEHEFAGALMEHAKLNKRDNESAAQSFSRILQSDPDIRRAYGITRGYMSIEPTWVEIGGTISEDDSKAAFDQLTEMANAQRAKAPWLSGDQAFSRVFSAPENAELANRAHRRPIAR